MIDEWLEELYRVEYEAHQLVDPMSEAQFAWRPAPGRWSVGECFDHVAITTALALPNLLAAVERGRAEGKTGSAPYRYGWLGGWFVRAMETPGKRPMRSPGNFVPPSGVPKTVVREKYFATQKQFRELIESARGLALHRIKAPSSAQGAGWLRLNLAAWFAATLAHARRHLAQARRVSESEGFPA